MSKPDPWYEARDLTDEERDRFRQISRRSLEAKRQAESGRGPEPIHAVNEPVLLPESLMPALDPSGMSSLSLFSGGGGLDIGFERAGFGHAASFEILDFAAATLVKNRPEWNVFGGSNGDVRSQDWRQFRGVDIVHGGPPCQPFSMAGRQRGADDQRDMFPEFVRIVLDTRPRAFVAENVPALLANKFKDYLSDAVLDPLRARYEVQIIVLRADAFGVPQVRKRVFFVGFRSKEAARRFRPPAPTHSSAHLPNGVGDVERAQADLFAGEASNLEPCMGVRQALGLPDIGFDVLAPTIRSSLTGPRHTTSALSSVSALKVWQQLQIWPNGVAFDRERARRFVPDNGHFRLSVQDCALIQGFPAAWEFVGAVYQALGQIGNAVPPPLGYRIARAVRIALVP